MFGLKQSGVGSSGCFFYFRN